MTARDQPFEHNRRFMALCAAAMYGAAALDGAVEIVLPHVPHFSLLPIYVVLGLLVAMLTAGPYLPRAVLALNGPIGVALVSYALATTQVTASDSAVLYALPVLWMSVFFGRRGSTLVVGAVAVGEAIALYTLGRYGYPERWVDVMVSVIAIAIVVRALEERNQRLVASLRQEARIDPLTGLLNRRGFDEEAEKLRGADREARRLTVVTFDIDHFKLVNDEWGHEVGDRVLQHVGRLLRGQVRGGDVLARFGGEEFVVLLPDTDRDGGARFANRVRAALVASDGDGGGIPRVRLSAGIATATNLTKIGALVANADIALYQAKRAGRDRVEVYAAA